MIRLLVVDDSALMRRLLVQIFEEAGDFEIAVARSGEEAISMALQFAPDVITLDINMPGMNGLACLDRIMLERPCPVVMLSSLTEAGAEETLEAMALGAVDFCAKPRGAISLAIEAIAPELVDKVRSASRSRISRAARLSERIRLRTRRSDPHPASQKSVRIPTPRKRAWDQEQSIVLIGTSTGGPPALDAVLAPLPADYPWPIMVAQHMPASFTAALAKRLNRLCAIHVEEVSKPTLLEPGHVYIGRGEADFIVSTRSGHLAALSAPASDEFHWHPSVDRLVASAMKHVAPERLIGVLMTGMGADGAATMAELKKSGGHVIAEAQETAVVWGMPGALVSMNGASEVVPLDCIAKALLILAQ